MWQGLDKYSYRNGTVIKHKKDDFRVPELRFPNFRICDFEPQEYSIPELAPSESLFKEYRRLVALNKWGKNSFEEYYVPRFLKDMQREDSKKMLQVLLTESKKKDIVLACFCTEESLCHRSIVAGILYNMGCDIECKLDYENYKLVL